MKKLLLIALILCNSFAAQALAVLPDEVLQDPALEARARTLSGNLRCLVCQNQSIDESEAPLARDLRILIRQQLQQNKTDGEIMQFLTDRYGDYILLKPPLTPVTFLAWFSPFIILAGAGLYLWNRRTRSEPETADLTRDEEKALQSALNHRESD